MGSTGREGKLKPKLATESGPRVHGHGGAWPRGPLTSPLLREVALTSHHKGGADLTGLPLAQQGGPKPWSILPSLELHREPGHSALSFPASGSWTYLLICPPTH